MYMLAPQDMTTSFGLTSAILAVVKLDCMEVVTIELHICKNLEIENNSWTDTYD